MIPETTQSTVAAKPGETLDRFISISKDTTSSDDGKRFVASSVWLGEKKGSYFGTGDEGTGYYIDSTQEKGGGNGKTKQKKSVRIAEDQNEMKLLIEDGSKFITGQNIFVDGGRTII